MTKNDLEEIASSLQRMDRFATYETEKLSRNKAFAKHPIVKKLYQDFLKELVIYSNTKLDTSKNTPKNGALTKVTTKYNKFVIELNKLSEKEREDLFYNKEKRKTI